MPQETATMINSKSFVLFSNRLILITGLFLLIFICPTPSMAQAPTITDSNTPLHALQPDYPVPYGTPKTEQVKAVLDKVYTYLNAATPMAISEGSNGKEITDFSELNEKSEFVRGDFRLISYEWGVTYAGMLLAGEVTGDSCFTRYAVDRLDFIADVVAAYRQKAEFIPAENTPVRSVLEPHALDDAGAMCAAMIKAHRLDLGGDLRPMIDNYIHYISDAGIQA